MAAKSKKPVLIIGFSRKEGVERTLLSLVTAGSMRVYLAIDGPKNQNQALLQEEMRASAEKIAAKTGMELHIWQRKQNLGLAVSVVTAIDWFFSEVEEGIILEDDLKFEKSFIDFVESGLEEFRNDSDTWLVSGNRFDSIELFNAKNAWSTYPLIWGWATWKDRWAIMRELLISDGKVINSIQETRVRNYWKTGFQRASSGKLDSWAAPLAAIQHSLRKYSLLPSTNLVSNLGQDVYATHTLTNAAHLNLDICIEAGVNEFSIANRQSISRMIDSAIEIEIYGISSKNSGSQVFMHLFDWARFPRRNRKSSLASRLSVCESPN